MKSDSCAKTFASVITHNRVQFNAERNNITIECDKFTVVYEHHQDENRSRHIRLHISKRSELGPPSVQNNQQQGQPRSNTIVINNDPSGITFDVSSQNSNNNSFKIIITNSDH